MLVSSLYGQGKSTRKPFPAPAPAPRTPHTQKLGAEFRRPSPVAIYRPNPEHDGALELAQVVKVRSTLDSDSEKTPRQRRAHKTPASTKPHRTPLEGSVTLKSLIDQLKVTAQAKTIRRALRKHFGSGNGTWAWAPDTDDYNWVVTYLKSTK